MRRIACSLHLTVALASAALACNSSGAPSEPSFGTLPLTLGPSDGSSGSSSGSTTSVPEDSTAAAGSTAIPASTGGTTLSLDVGVPDAGTPGPEGCRGKIDFLFVVARDFNMELIQYKVVSAFPKFIATIEERFADFDYQIMVVDGDQEWGNDYCNESCAHPLCDVDDYPCEAVASLTECDQTLGAGTIFNAGELSFNKPCPVAGGKRYLVKGQPDLPGTFQCIAQVGTDGWTLVGDALAAAVTPAKTAHCNDGFIRDDALLFVSIITWAAEQVSVTSPEEWAQAVLDAKHGDPEAVVMFAVSPLSSLGFTSLEECAKDKSAGRLCKMMEFFPRRLLVDKAQPSYGPGFEQAADLVEEACSAFIPK